jgi:hypothetical protein
MVHLSLLVVLVMPSGASIAFAVASTASKLSVGIAAILLSSVCFCSFLHHLDEHGEDLAREGRPG